MAKKLFAKIYFVFRMILKLDRIVTVSDQIGFGHLYKCLTARELLGQMLIDCRCS